MDIILGSKKVFLSQLIHSNFQNPSLVKNVSVIDHRSWLTLAIRVPVKYTWSVYPSPSLKTLALFICQVYSPIWFRIKCRTKLTCVVSHLYHFLQLVNTQPEEVQQVVRKLIQNNAFFCSSWNHGNTMLESDNKSIQKTAVNIIKKNKD